MRQNQVGFLTRSSALLARPKQLHQCRNTSRGLASVFSESDPKIWQRSKPIQQYECPNALARPQPQVRHLSASPPQREAYRRWRAPPEANLALPDEQQADEPSPQERQSLQPFSSIKEDDEILKRQELRETERLQSATYEELERELNLVANNRPHVSTVQKILKILFEEHDVRPTAMHYEAMILANCDAEHGSLDAVKALLGEMERERIVAGSSIYDAVLKVLAIHPDHLFRSHIEYQMNRQWMMINEDSTHHIIAGLVRDGQLEVAMHKILTHHSPLAPWLYITILHALCAAEDFPAVEQLLYVLDDRRIELSPLTWLLVLEAASSALYLDVVKYIWIRQVEPMYVTPPTGVCWDALLAASRTGDVALAESIVEVLARKEEDGEAAIHEVVWKMLSEAYENSGDQEGKEKVAARSAAGLEKQAASAADAWVPTGSVQT